MTYKFTGEDQQNPFLCDVRDVVQRMKDKSYGTLGEAFEDFFHDCWELEDGQVKATYFED